ncbi:hypothetical protein BDV25DRAFT_164878 [Aspergillus avenaceus]|uniref:C2H2-type domain-containing protein n=1 Tax=Aspergillus avenaceus TaxID=36643 RepID=A0A5N6TG53_ASPAV|nr:hypothetical protein BDV25DRAFT_164878 [Aspergillus avenaceus]
MTRGSTSGTETISSSRSPAHLLTVLNTPHNNSNSMSSSSTSRRQGYNTRSSSMAGKKITGTMRQNSTQPAEIPLPITYTPTTHRISKAKKGKRVHACEYPGCNKVFTRAEHRRRHELNHNPEALFRCTHAGCKKAFHRPDLLARHSERHELEAQMNNAPWGRQNPVPMVPEPSFAHKGASVDSHGSYLAVTQPASSISIGSLVGPPIHPDLANDCGLMWMGMNMQSEHQTPIYPGHIHESVEDQYYSSPEACPSPSSDGATMSIPSHSRSSVASTPTAIVDAYPENLVDPELTSSPMPMHANLRSWETPEAPLPSSSFTPVSVSESLAQSPFHCQYPSPTWPPAHGFGYEEPSLPSGSSFPPPLTWKSFVA